MLGVVKVLGGVLILGRVTTPDIPADQAHAQVNPGVAGLNAVFANVFIGLSYFDLIEVGALFRHRFLLR
jgi:hypothetical protein